MTSNQVHGFLSEYGVFCAKCHKSQMATMAEALAPESNLLSSIAIEAIQDESKRLIMLCKDTPLYYYLLSIPHICIIKLEIA